MKCPKCGNEMKNIIHFEEGKEYAFHECKICKTKTHQKRINYQQFEKEEINEKTVTNY